MRFILSKIPVVEELLRTAITGYFSDLRWSALYTNFPSINVSNDHPFERLLDGSEDNTLFPAITIVSNTDGEIPNASKGWETAELDDGDLDGFDNLSWHVSDDALSDLRGALAEHKKVYGLSHSTVWRDSVSCEIWTENMQIKNDIYSLLLGYFTGPTIMEFKQATGVVIPTNTVKGQRSGYYNYDFGRVLYGARISLEADYPILQAVYDTTIEDLAEIQHSYREVLHG